MMVLETYAVFGDGKLYVFRYPPIREERTIPLMVDSGGVVREDYVVEYELNITKMLFSVPSGLTEPSGHLDPNSVRVKTAEGSELPTQFDGFQGFFYDASSNDTWSKEVSDDVIFSDGDVLTYSVNFTDMWPERHRLTYNGRLEVDVERHRFLEVKWLEMHNLTSQIIDVAFVRFNFWTKNGNRTEIGYKWGNPSSEWGITSFDLSWLNGTLTRLDIDLFDAKPGNWSVNYNLYIDWLRFVADVGTVRWLYNSTVHSIEQYTIKYDFLENTEINGTDGLPRMYNITSNNNQTVPPPQVKLNLLFSLAIRSVDLMGQPVGNVAIEIRELNVSAATDADGWAVFNVPLGRWTLTILENGNIRERTIEVLTNVVTLEKINSIKVDGVMTNVWIYGLLVAAIILACILPLAFLHKKISMHISLSS
jgi:hypothetical protein